MPEVSALVAFRETPDGSRGRLWDFVRSRFERFLPDVEIVVGTDDSMPFCKTAALNRAAAEASGDVFLVWDADTWVRSGQTELAVRRAIETKHWTRPYSYKAKLLRADTERILGEQDWDGDLEGISQFEAQTPYWPAPPFVIPRHQWEAVSGMDERFSGWGQEDEAFGLSVRALFGPPWIVRSRAVHLWHPRIGKSGKDRWEGQTTTNVALAEGYRAAGRKAETMKEFLEARHG